MDKTLRKLQKGYFYHILDLPTILWLTEKSK